MRKSACLASWAIEGSLAKARLSAIEIHQWLRTYAMARVDDASIKRRIPKPLSGTVQPPSTWLLEMRLSLYFTLCAYFNFADSHQSRGRVDHYEPVLVGLRIEALKPFVAVFTDIQRICSHVIQREAFRGG